MLVLLICNIATWLNFCRLMSSRNHVVTLLKIANALLAGCTWRRIDQQRLTINHILTYHVSLVISNFRYRFQNIGRLRLTMCLFSEKEKNPKSWKIFSFFSFLALHHIYAAVCHRSHLFDYNAGLHVPAWLLQRHIIVRFIFLWGLLMKMANACRLADMYTACCRLTEFHLW